MAEIPSEVRTSLLETIRVAHAILDAGWATSPDLPTEARQADALTRMSVSNAVVSYLLNYQDGQNAQDRVAFLMRPILEQIDHVREQYDLYLENATLRDESFKLLSERVDMLVQRLDAQQDATRAIITNLEAMIKVGGSWKYVFSYRAPPPGGQLPGPEMKEG